MEPKTFKNNKIIPLLSISTRPTIRFLLAKQSTFNQNAYIRPLMSIPTKANVHYKFIQPLLSIKTPANIHYKFQPWHKIRTKHWFNPIKQTIVPLLSIKTKANVQHHFSQNSLQTPTVQPLLSIHTKANIQEFLSKQNNAKQFQQSKQKQSKIPVLIKPITNTFKTSVLQSKHKIIINKQNKTNWSIQNSNCETILLGDQNIHNISRRPNTSIQTQAFADVIPTNFSNMFLKDKQTHPKLKHSILSFGMKSINNKSSTNAQQIKRLMYSYKDWMPQTTKYVSLLQWDTSTLTKVQTNNINNINSCIQTSAKQYQIKVLNHIHPKKFNIKNGLWTTNTANFIMAHWFKTINTN